MGVVAVVAGAFSADIRTTPSEQKLRSGPTRVGELERESLGDVALTSELRLAVMGSRTLAGDPVNDVIEASSVVAVVAALTTFGDPPTGMGGEVAVEVESVAVVVSGFGPEGWVVATLAIESADFPRAEGGELEKGERWNWKVMNAFRFRPNNRQRPSTSLSLTFEASKRN